MYNKTIGKDKIVKIKNEMVKYLINLKYKLIPIPNLLNSLSFVLLKTE